MLASETCMVQPQIQHGLYLPRRRCIKNLCRQTLTHRFGRRPKGGELGVERQKNGILAETF